MDDELLEQLPPGPWRWEQVVPEPHPVDVGEPGPAGWGIVAADDTWVLTVDSALGSPDVWPREFGVDPGSAVARALAMVPDLVAEHEDLWIALDEVVDVLRRFDAGDPPWPETARDLVRVLGDLCERLAGDGGPTTVAGRPAVAPSGETATDDRARPGAAEAIAKPGAEGQRDATAHEWVDDYGTGAARPDLEAMYDGAPDHWRQVLWWAFALESRVHELELALGQELAPTAGEVLDAARAGDEDAQQIVEAARAEVQRRVAERVEELRARMRDRSGDVLRDVGDLDPFSERPETDGGTGEEWDLLRRVRDALVAGDDPPYREVSLLARAAWDWRARLDEAREAALSRLGAREVSWLDLLDAYTAELGLGDDVTVAELRRQLGERRSPEP